MTEQEMYTALMSVKAYIKTVQSKLIQSGRVVLKDCEKPLYGQKKGV